MFKTTGIVKALSTSIGIKLRNCKVYVILTHLNSLTLRNDHRRRVFLLQLVNLDSRESTVQQKRNTLKLLVAQISNIPDNNPDWRCPVLLLSKRLDELATTRRQLLSQLVFLDARIRITQLEHRSLYNLDVPILNIPDDVLAIMFEEGMHPRDRKCHFEFLVSHGTRRWRHFAISTPKLWSNMCCIGHHPWSARNKSSTGDSPTDDSTTDHSTIHRASNFFSRARSFPVDIYVKGFLDSDFSKSMQLFSDRIGHYRRLRIVGGDCVGISRVLACASSQSTLLLTPIDLGGSGNHLRFREQLFPLGAPRLTTARFDNINIQTIHLCLTAFESNRGIYMVYSELLS